VVPGRGRESRSSSCTTRMALRCSANSLANVLFPADILPQRNISVAEVFMLSAGFHARPRLNVRFLPGRRSWVLAFLTRPRALGAVPLVANLCASLGSTERGAACGVVIGRVELAIARRFATCVDFYEVAPRAGLEPATLRLTAGCSAIELPRNRTCWGADRGRGEPNDRNG
jgi:hypothetical protein